MFPLCRKNKINSEVKHSTKNFSLNIDEVINNQLLLSSLRILLQDEVILDRDVKGHRAKQQKLKHNAPILFVKIKIKISRGKKVGIPNPVPLKR